MADTSQIREHMKIIDAEGVHFGTVDHVDGDRIKLTKNDAPDGKHHWLSAGLVAGVEGDEIRLSATAANAQLLEEDS